MNEMRRKLAKPIQEDEELEEMPVEVEETTLLNKKEDIGNTVLKLRPEPEKHTETGELSKQERRVVLEVSGFFFDALKETGTLIQELNESFEQDIQKIELGSIEGYERLADAYGLRVKGAAKKTVGKGAYRSTEMETLELTAVGKALDSLKKRRIEAAKKYAKGFSIRPLALVLSSFIGLGSAHIVHNEMRTLSPSEIFEAVSGVDPDDLRDSVLEYAENRKK